jgi:WD40 repeat protein
LQALKGHAHAVKVLAFSPDQQRLASGSSIVSQDLPNSLISVWDVKSGQKLFHLDKVGIVNRLTFSGATTLVAAVNREVNAWDIDSGQPTNVSGLAANLNTNPEFVQGAPLTVASGDKQWTAVAQGASFSLSGRGGNVTTQQPRPLALRAINFSLDGKLIAVGQANGDLTLWDAELGRPIRTFQGRGSTENNIVHSVGFTADDAHIFMATWSSGVWMWDLSQSGSPIVVHNALTGLQVSGEASGQRMLAEMNPILTRSPPSPPSRFTARVDDAPPSPSTEEVYTAAAAPGGKLFAFGGYSWNDTARGGFIAIVAWDTLQRVDHDLSGVESNSVRSLSFSSSGDACSWVFGRHNGHPRLCESQICSSFEGSFWFNQHGCIFTERAASRIWRRGSCCEDLGCVLGAIPLYPRRSLRARSLRRILP